ncbi:MAG: hypothetical protein U9R08_04360 [Nanoarchaeota archaeon]|nr:hypothetical protein [Nanoarchaeota archaeon]
MSCEMPIGVEFHRALSYFDKNELFAKKPYVAWPDEQRLELLRYMSSELEASRAYQRTKAEVLDKLTETILELEVKINEKNN